MMKGVLQKWQVLLSLTVQEGGGLQSRLCCASRACSHTRLEHSFARLFGWHGTPATGCLFSRKADGSLAGLHISPGRWPVRCLMDSVTSWRSKSVRPQDGHDT